jgi:hypothetical protein
MSLSDIYREISEHHAEPNVPRLHEQPRNVWNKTDILERLQCLLKAKVNMLRYDERGTKALKDARAEISRLRAENENLKVMLNTCASQDW